MYTEMEGRRLVVAPRRAARRRPGAERRIYAQFKRWAALGAANNHQLVVFNGERATAVLPDRDQDLGTVEIGDRISYAYQGRIEVDSRSEVERSPAASERRMRAWPEPPSPAACPENIALLRPGAARARGCRSARARCSTPCGRDGHAADDPRRLPGHARSRAWSSARAEACVRRRVRDLLDAARLPRTADRRDVARGRPKSEDRPKPEAGADPRRRGALQAGPGARQAAPRSTSTLKLSVSADEILRAKDFAQMTSAEITAAAAEIARLRLPRDRSVAGGSRRPAGAASIRGAPSAVRCGPGGRHRPRATAPVTAPPPVVAICDISGSVARLHAPVPALPASRWRRGGRSIVPVRDAADQHHARAARTRTSTRRSPPCRVRCRTGRAARASPSRCTSSTALAAPGAGQGGDRRCCSRTGWNASIRRPRRRDARLHRSCRRLIWVNPLLRFDGFEAQRVGDPGHVAPR